MIKKMTIGKGFIAGIILYDSTYTSAFCGTGYLLHKIICCHCSRYLNYIRIYAVHLISMHLTHRDSPLSSILKYRNF